MEGVMLTALVLVCTVAVTPDLRACTADNAKVVMHLPAEFASPVTCFMHGQTYMAETSLGRQLDDGDRVKIVCMRSKTFAASSRD
jgi:hypothetical protein